MDVCRCGADPSKLTYVAETDTVCLRQGTLPNKACMRSGNLRQETPPATKPAAPAAPGRGWEIRPNGGIWGMANNAFGNKAEEGTEGAAQEGN